ncbi:MerR family transcriptional regulator [Streptomyces zaomyceticus]|uniref:MerR family transcriptional regulator n=1 Tax=Streptomyces zaomyceticus TaxID=68286 RepID=UPI0016739763|nr:MerR family transcriptional regulator [Streptomyces zaomyceticus]GHG42362.1 MerR family transcriptional regulator [Streptomyces zaomyceticus]
MRIGEIAALVGVTPRAVRHYHQSGLLPEPARRANGYREYGVRDAVLLARIRRLTELGLGLDEVRVVLADDEGRGLVEVMEELSQDLARQEAEIRDRRERLATLLDEARAGRLPADGPLSPELSALLAGLGELPESPMAAKDREILALLDAVVPEAERSRLMGLMEGAAEHAREVYPLLDALSGAEADDPRVAEAAGVLAACLPDELGVEIPTAGSGGAAGVPGASLADALFADLAPAQSAAVHLAMRLVRERREQRP